jgi:outer membrane protein OmpA-like peptidoglycan-associated protein
MKIHPDAWLSITGTTSGTLQDAGLKLARARAEEVRSMMNKLGVYDDRLRVSARVYPERPTTFADSGTQFLAQEENRRVELASNNPAILAPVKLGTVEKLHSPASIIIRSEVDTSRDSTSNDYTLAVRRGRDNVASRAMGRSDGKGSLTLDLHQDLQGSSGDSLFVEITTVRDGRTVAIAKRQIPLVQDEEEYTKTSRSGDLEIERYGLILFEFDDSRISKQHERQLQFIRSRIRENTTVTIIGATDQIGSQAYNRELSLKRAKEVARRLGVPGTTVIGNGEESPSLPNELPEGRASNRTVIIQLATPVR